MRARLDETAYQDLPIHIVLRPWSALSETAGCHHAGDEEQKWPYIVCAEESANRYSHVRAQLCHLPTGTRHVAAPILKSPNELFLFYLCAALLHVVNVHVFLVSIIFITPFIMLNVKKSGAKVEKEQLVRGFKYGSSY